MLIRYLALILGCQLIGETITVTASVPIPGPVLGMAILFAGLLIKRGLSDDLASAGGGLLRHLALMFVPAGVGVMLHVPRLADEWWPIALAIVPGTLVALAITALLVQWLGRKTMSEADRV